MRFAPRQGEFELSHPPRARFRGPSYLSPAVLWLHIRLRTFHPERIARRVGSRDGRKHVRRPFRKHTSHVGNALSQEPPTKSVRALLFYHAGLRVVHTS
jgi:hypothetical protein